MGGESERKMMGWIVILTGELLQEPLSILVSNNKSTKHMNLI
jgi:hypothetical protein